MRKSTLLKMAMTLTAMFFISGVFAQIALTVKNSDGTPATSCIIYTQLSSSPGTVTAVAGVVEAPAGTYTWTPGAVGTYNYIISNNVPDAWNTYALDYTGAVSATITLRSNFNPTIREYTATRTGDKVTNGKPMPFWVYPSPVHNPSWVAPAADYASQATIETNVVSTFAWTVNGVANAATRNYVQLTPSANLAATATTTSAVALSVTETSDAAYGGCSGSPVNFFNTVINPPYAEITGTTASAPLTIATLGFQKIVSACEGDPSLTTNIALNFANTQEEFPFYMRLVYNVYNPTVSGNDLALGAALAATSFPAGLRPQSNADGLGGGDANQTTNPMMFSGPSYTPNVYAANVTFTTVNNAVTVYEFDLNEWNAKISRKSDYVAWRTAAVAPILNSNNWTWYDNTAIANTFDASASVTKAYVVVFPKPVTGPIYHIPNSWGL